MSTRRTRAIVAIAAVVVAVVAGVLGAAPAAGAAEVPVSGSFTAVGSFDSQPDCPMFHTWHDGGGDWTGLGTATFHLDYCVDLQFPPVPSSPLVGTFTIEADGGTLTGSVTGQVSNTGGPDGYPADYELTITAGTGAYDRATGFLTFDAVWNDPVAPVFAMEGTVSGVVVVPPPTPTSPDDCRHGGWRDLADENGDPFRNQGDCIAWAHRHT
jgi:hypothetical protein